MKPNIEISGHKNSLQVYAAILALAFIAGLSIPALASPENEEVRTRLRMEYFNESGNRKLVCTLLARIDKRYSPLPDAAIHFFLATDTVPDPLGTATTDEYGKATLSLQENLLDESGSWGTFNFEAAFEGYDNFLGSTADKTVKDAVMSIEFSKKEDQKLVILNFSETGDEDSIPTDNVLVSFYVPRTFSLLEFGEGEISNGTCSIEFPTDIPGDTIGFITIVAKVNDHDEYGTVVASNGINWGKPVPPEEVVNRGLGDTNAPLWMVYTLIVLLSLVWFHYLYAVFTIYRIKKEGNKIDLQEEATG